jgi:hypothetical protein
MAKYHDLNISDTSFLADADLTAKQYYFVMAASTDGYVKLATGASNPTPLGILQNSPSAGQEARVRLLGPSKVIGENGTCNLKFGKIGYVASDGQFEIAASLSGPFNARWIGNSYTTAGSIVGEAFFYGGLATCSLDAC